MSSLEQFSSYALTVSAFMPNRRDLRKISM